MSFNGACERCRGKKPCEGDKMLRMCWGCEAIKCGCRLVSPQEGVFLGICSDECMIKYESKELNWKCKCCGEMHSSIPSKIGKICPALDALIMSKTAKPSSSK